jgi:hypothetical protein
MTSCTRKRQAGQSLFSEHRYKRTRRTGPTLNGLPSEKKIPLPVCRNLMIRLRHLSIHGQPRQAPTLTQLPKLQRKAVRRSDRPQRNHLPWDERDAPGFALTPSSMPRKAVRRDGPLGNRMSTIQRDDDASREATRLDRAIPAVAGGKVGYPSRLWRGGVVVHRLKNDG